MSVRCFNDDGDRMRTNFLLALKYTMGPQVLEIGSSYRRLKSQITVYALLTATTLSHNVIPLNTPCGLGRAYFYLKHFLPLSLHPSYTPLRILLVFQHPCPASPKLYRT